MIVIVGDGVAAGVLHRALGDIPHYVVKGPPHKTKCGKRPCGWGIAQPGIDIIKSFGIDPPILRYSSHVILAGREMKAEVWSIDKPRLIESLLKDAIVADSANDSNLVVDATGLARARIGPAENDFCARNFQMRFRDASGPIVPRFDLIHGGYKWFIPLGCDESHIGIGSVTLSNQMLAFMLSDMSSRFLPEVICRCSESVRLSGLAYPIIKDNVVAVGEAAGTVVPLGGAGIVPSMQSTLLLASILRQGGTSQDYAVAMKKRFGVLSHQRKALERMLNRGSIHPYDWWTFYAALRQIGLRPGLSDMKHVFKLLRESLTK